MTESLELLAEDWNRALAVVAYPDDMEYGAASAVARWTDQGKDVAYLLVTRGEAGIAFISPAEAGPAREQEQRRSCAVVGVRVVQFLDRPDGLVVADLDLRRDLAARYGATVPMWCCRSTTGTAGDRKVGTTPTTATSAWRCSTPYAMPQTRGSSPTRDRRGRACVSPHSTPRRNPLTASTSATISSGASSHCAATSSTSATWADRKVIPRSFSDRPPRAREPA